MSGRTVVPGRVCLSFVAAFLCVTILSAGSSVVLAGGNFRNGSVGGISINVSGVVGQPVSADGAKWLKLLRETVNKAPEGLDDLVELRKISLRRLEQAIAEAVKNDHGVLPDEIKYLAGITRIKYIFLYPEANDIVLAGPGEGWEVDAKTACVVGSTTGRPVLLLDDLLMALRNANNARQGQGISCSINPTQDGRQRFDAYIKSLRTFKAFNKNHAQEAMGSQTITLTGVPATSHFARVLVAADYRMKRYAMGLEKPPIQGLPNFLQLMKAARGRLTNAMPRWWLACDYKPLARSEDGLAWELRGPGVKALTEDDFVAADGTVTGRGGKNPIAEKWATIMTEKYDELSAKDPVFSELRNLMDMCVVAALIEKEDMLNMVDLRLPLLTTDNADLRIPQWHAPKTVGTQISFLKASGKVLITASGGVQVDSWAVARKTEKSPQIGQVRTKAKVADKKKWWWN